jgi:hypothetical protein
MYIILYLVVFMSLAVYLNHRTPKRLFTLFSLYKTLPYFVIKRTSLL